MDTFVVRVWNPVPGEEAVMGFRGVVERVSTGASERFRNVDELVTFLRTPGPDTKRPTAAPGEGRPKR